MTAAAIAQLTDLRSSTTELVRGLDTQKWSDADVRAPSLLPGWTRAHVLTHIARNADGIARTISGALRGEVVERYPGGSAARNADIEAGAGRTSLELVADVRDSADRLDRVFGAVVDADGWELPTAETRTVLDWIVRRWREVEVHRTDLGGSYGPSDWPAAFVSYLVPAVIPTLAQRSPQAVRIEIEGGGSVTTDLPDASWTIGEGAATLVRGPDWAVAAWLVGRPAAAGAAVTAAPDLGPWL